MKNKIACKSLRYKYKNNALFIYILLMNNKTKKTIETIKEEAKNYYKWKKMWPRYAIIWFLLLIIVLQFILPKQKKILVDEQVAEITWDITEENQENVFNFLWKDMDLDMNFEKSLVKILDKRNELLFIYKYKTDILNKLWDELKEKDIPEEFRYFILLNQDENTIFPFEWDLNDNLIVDEEINERLNYYKSLDNFVEYVKYLYNNFDDDRLVVIWYFMWLDNLKILMMEQSQTDFEKLYFPLDVLEKYYNLMAYAYIYNNILGYIDIEDVSVVEYPETWKVRAWEIKDLVRRAKKAKYDFKLIKELNPWILQNSLPKWKREITVPN